MNQIYNKNYYENSRVFLGRYIMVHIHLDGTGCFSLVAYHFVQLLEDMILILNI